MTKTQTVFFGDVLVITPATGVSETSLARSFLAAIDSGSARILVDLQELEGADRRRIGELLLYRELAREAGGDLKLLKPRGAIWNLLRALKLTLVFEVHHEFNRALASFGKATSMPYPGADLCGVDVTPLS